MKGPTAMIAPFPTTSSRASRSASSEPTSSESTVGSPPTRAVDWGARLVQFGLALYLIPVLVVIFLIGGVGIAIVGLVALAGKAACWVGRPRGVDEAEDVAKS